MKKIVHPTNFPRTLPIRALLASWLCGVSITHAAPTATPGQTPPLETHVAVLAIAIGALLVGVAVSFSRRKSAYSHPEEDEL